MGSDPRLAGTEIHNIGHPAESFTSRWPTQQWVGRPKDEIEMVWHTGRSMPTAPDRAPMNLPVHLTSFIGRTADVAAVDDLVAGARLITLTGPGGAGKTRLAIRVATGQADRFDGGIWWVELASLSDSAAVADAVATVVGVPVEPASGLVRSLAAYLAGRRALICLDNAEHIVDAVAALADPLLRASPDVTLLVTSREPLGIPGEAIWRVPPLQDEDAVRLFVERARFVQPGFALDPNAESAVQSIVRQLDGIPLALELAAAWLATLTPDQILDGLEDRFRLLVRGPRGAQRRQQTLANSIGWSHTLLDEVDRAVFRRLAVFAGSFGLDAVLALAAGDPVDASEVLPALGRLVDKSLVMADGAGRYRMLETIRAYAAARLREAREDSALRDRHLAWSVAFAEAADTERERNLDAWTARVEPEGTNLRAALDWGLAAEDPEAGRRMAASLAWMWHLSRRGREGIGYLRRSVARRPDDRSPTQARLLAGIALVADSADPLDQEYEAASRALEIATEVGDQHLRALCLSLKAVGAFYTSFDEARALCDEALAAAAAGGNEFARDGAHALQAIILHLQDRHAEADDLFDGCIPGLLRRHRGVAASALGFQATGFLYRGDLARAAELAEQAVTTAEPLRDYLRVGMARSVLAAVHTLAGELDAAQAAIDPVIQVVGDDDVKDEVHIPGLGSVLGAMALRRGDAGAARRWFDHEAKSMDRGVATWVAGPASVGLGVSMATLGADAEATAALERAVAVAKRLGMPKVRADALHALGRHAARKDDGLGRALDLCHAALAERVDRGLRAFLPDSLEAIAGIGSRIRSSVDDVRALAAADTARRSLGIPRAQADRDAFDATWARLRSDLGAEIFSDAWSAGLATTLDDAVAHVRRTRGARGRPATGWASLTPAELEVIRLVADGLSNPDVGARLFMSRGTVKTHLAHVFIKLDVANRTELAAFATGRLERDG
jgi:predicted ATPase/DNA-binding CsgD family transcriptional regulator